VDHSARRIAQFDMMQAAYSGFRHLGRDGVGSVTCVPVVARPDGAVGAEFQDQ
jgi:hypothetical protein